MHRKIALLFSLIILINHSIEFPSSPEERRANQRNKLIVKQHRNTLKKVKDALETHGDLRTIAEVIDKKTDEFPELLNAPSSSTSGPNSVNTDEAVRRLLQVLNMGSVKEEIEQLQATKERGSFDNSRITELLKRNKRGGD